MTTHLNQEKIKITQSLRIFRLFLPYIGAIAAVWMALKEGIHMGELIALYFLVVLTGTGFTVGYHRLFAHRSFETGQPVRILLGIIGLMGTHLTITEYAAIHRTHHAFSDRPGDPHSPQLESGNGYLKTLRGLWHAHTGWLFDSNLDWEAKIKKYAADLVQDPVISTLDRLHYLWILLGLILPALVGGTIAHSWDGAISALVWCGLFRMFIQDQIEFCTRSLAHYFGDRAFGTKDMSTNNWIAIFALGEWHNNHHAFPHSANQGLEPWQFDFSYLVISTLEKLGLASNVKKVSSGEIIAAKKLNLL